VTLHQKLDKSAPILIYRVWTSPVIRYLPHENPQRCRGFPKSSSARRNIITVAQLHA